ncbi:unnamed protein product [Absidia cylindrospora]
MNAAYMTQLKQSHTFFAFAFFDKEKNERYECPTCHKRFNRPSALRTHNFTHSGERPYACDVLGCGRRFSVVSNLRRHSKVHNRTSSQRTRLSSNERNKYVQRLIDRGNQAANSLTQMNQSSTDFPTQEVCPPVSRLSVQWLMNDDTPGSTQNPDR